MEKEKLLVGLDAGVKTRLANRASRVGVSMAQIVRTAVAEHLETPETWDPEQNTPYTVPVDIHDTLDVDDLHTFLYDSQEYSDRPISAEERLSDGFQCGPSVAEGSGANIIFLLLRVKEDFEKGPFAWGLAAKAVVRQSRRHGLIVDFQDRRFNPSRGRIPESEFGAGASLVILTAGKNFRDGDPCSFIVLAHAEAVTATYKEIPGYGQFAQLPEVGVEVKFARGTFGRCTDGEKLLDKLRAMRGAF